MRWTVPNILTILRLLAAPLVAVMFLYFTRPYADWFALFLFIAAALTDWMDGRLARAWDQETKLGTMLDPIADKAMVVIALMVIVAYSSYPPYLILPASVIVFREVFVSGMREYLGNVAGALKVTVLAKWKTTAQMLAIAILFSKGVFEHYLGMSTYGMDADLVDAIMAGDVPDHQGLRWKHSGWVWSWYAGIWLLWIAAALTLITGVEYFYKAMPFLKEEDK